MKALLLAVALVFALVDTASAELQPSIEQLVSEDGGAFEAHIFTPAASDRPRAAMILLHGGGWVAGDATWVYPRARRFAGQGMVAVAVEYRLGNPEHATADARALIRWLRANAERLNIDPERIGAYGVSAGGQISVSAAQSDDASARPNAIVLVSPALDVARDGWFMRLVGSEDTAARLSPLANVRAGLPPTLVLQGDVDTETPLVRARAFCDAMNAAGNECVLKTYIGYGHLFTPAGINDRDTPQPDAATSAAAADMADGFLRRHGFVN